MKDHKKEVQLNGRDLTLGVNASDQIRWQWGFLEKDGLALVCLKFWILSLYFILFYSYVLPAACCFIMIVNYAKKGSATISYLASVVGCFDEF